MEAIQALISADMRAVDRRIRDCLHSDVVLIRQVSEYIIYGGGKRLRPMLVLLSSGLFGYQGESHIELATIIELIHTATLLHDDVVDQSELRRGNKTTNALFGNAASVLVGDFIYSRSFQMMVGIGLMRVMAVLSEATNVIAEGEVLQLMNVHDAGISEERYLQVIRYKTAKLFEVASRLGAIISNAKPEQEEAMASYGMHLGTAFQLIDDVLDYSGDHEETGKNIGDDLAEGKPTLPLIYAIQHGNSAQAATVQRAIMEGGRNDLDEVIAAIKQTGALDYAKVRAQQESTAACAAIEALPNSTYKDSLLQLASFAVTRTY